MPHFARGKRREFVNILPQLKWPACQSRPNGLFCQAEHKTPTPSGVGVLCSATGSGHVITCTARRWVVSGRLYCFQRPPAEGRREACKPSTDPTSRITNVRINRTAAHRSIFSFDVFSALPSSNRLDVQKVRHRRFAIGRTKNPAERGVCAFPAAPRLGEKSSQFSGSTGGVSSSAGRKILLIFQTRYSPSRLAVHKVQRRRPVIGRTKNYSSSSDRICSINRS